MPMPWEETVVKVLVKHPVSFIIYAVCIGIGWLAPRLIPDECHRDNDRLRMDNAHLLRRGDSIQATKDQLMQDYIERGVIIQKTDSLVFKIGEKAGQVLKQKSHEH